MDYQELFNVNIGPSPFWDARPMVPQLYGTKVGDLFYIVNGNNKVLVKVEEINYYRDFGDAWFTLDKELIQDPEVVTHTHAIKYFQKYFHQTLVDKYGIIALKFSY